MQEEINIKDFLTILDNNGYVQSRYLNVLMELCSLKIISNNKEVKYRYKQWGGGYTNYIINNYMETVCILNHLNINFNCVNYTGKWIESRSYFSFSFNYLKDLQETCNINFPGIEYPINNLLEKGSDNHYIFRKFEPSEMLPKLAYDNIDRFEDVFSIMRKDIVKVDGSFFICHKYSNLTPDNMDGETIVTFRDKGKIFAEFIPDPNKIIYF